MPERISQQAWLDYLKGQEFTFRCPHCQNFHIGDWGDRGASCPLCEKQGLLPTKSSTRKIKGEFIKFKRGLKCMSAK